MRADVAVTSKAAVQRRRKVFLTATINNSTLFEGQKLAKRYEPQSFEFTTSKDEADIVLYLESGYVGLVELPMLLSSIRSAPKALHFMFSESDWPFPILPGAYTSLDRPCPWAKTWSYLPADLGFDLARSPDPKYLFSFLGRAGTHPIRKAVLQLDRDSSPCIDVDSASQRLSDFDYIRSYWNLIVDSKFVLCPRGYGASSIRTFETMSAGRVPVIISDKWQRSSEIPWHNFCVFIQEKNVPHIPTILAQLEADSHVMGRTARQVFEQWFSPKVFFERLLHALVADYSACRFSVNDSMLRTWRMLRWREVKSVLSQIKSVAVQSPNPRTQ